MPLHSDERQHVYDGIVEWRERELEYEEVTKITSRTKLILLATKTKPKRL